jgi:hypothetical protein
MQIVPVSFYPPILPDLVRNVGIAPIMLHSGLFCAAVSLFPFQKFRLHTVIGTCRISVRASKARLIFFSSGASPWCTHSPNPFLTSFIRSSQYFARARQMAEQFSDLAQQSQGFFPAVYSGASGTIPFCLA